MPWKPKTIEKKYFSIGEVAIMFNVAPSLIRFWEKEFDILKPRKNTKGNRQFTREDIENFKRIYNLVKEKGYTLQGAKDELKNARLAEDVEEHEQDRMEETIDTLKRLRGFLVELEGKL